ncbi:MAG: hypothetical protein ACK5KU_04715 [Beutenbergiaceae bacterium]
MASGTGRRSARTLAVIAVAAGALAAGCAPVTTLEPYAASDGVRGVLEEITVNNLLVLSDGEGEPALVVAGLHNNSDETVVVGLEFGANGRTTVTVPAHDSVMLDPGSPEGETVLLDAIDGAPGSVTEVRVTTASAGSILLNVPILNGTLEPYGDYLARYGQPQD